MATRVKEGLAGKEKRGISNFSKKSPSTSKDPSPNRRLDSTTPERNIPNYLKPTISSCLDASKSHVKKHPSNDSAAQKATLARRRSFDKPLLPSHVQKTRVSPNPREKTIRSSSFTIKTTTTAQKSPSDRLSKVPKSDGKEPSLHPRPKSVKSVTVKKPETQDNKFSVEPPMEISPCKVDPPDVVDSLDVVDNQEQEMDSSISEIDEDILNVGKKDLSVAEEILALENKVHSNVTESELESHEVQEVKKIEVSPTLKVEEDAPFDDRLEELEAEPHVAEITNTHSEILEQPHGEKERDINNKIIEEEPKIDVQKKEGENEDEDTSAVQTFDQKDENVTGDQVPDTQHETDSTGDVAKKVKQDLQRETTKPEVVQGKKDSAPVSNDVIEETANKLREQRKNKVKALAGAFETVISLQEK